ncbi:MAG: zinc ribbon domain-containing protein [Anaerolineae bacterium]|nr:zinc ribbon domain-containing protein [Anaerolineae bacterium]
MKCSKCGTELAPEDKFCGKCGTLRSQLSPRFAETERRFASLRARYQAGGLDDAIYDAELQKLVVADDAGGRWMLGADSGEWYCFDGQRWVRRDPPPAAAPAMPPLMTAAPAPVAVPVASPTAKGFPWKWIALGLGGLLILAVIVVVGVVVVPRLLPLGAALPQPVDAAPTEAAVDATVAPTTIVVAPTVAPSPAAMPPGGISGEAIEHPESGLAFHSHAAVRSEDGNGLYVFGEIENTSDGTVDANTYEVLVTFYDAAGGVIQTESPWQLSAPLLRPVLAPGQTAYFLHLFSRDLGGHEDIVDRADRYTVEVRSGELPRNYVELSVQDLSWSPGSKLTGTVVNDTEFTISRSGPVVWLGLYDADGQLIDVRSAISDPEFLTPGKSRSFWAFQDALSGASTVEAVALGVPAEGLVFFDDFSDPGSGWEVYSLPFAEVRYEEEALVLIAKGPGGIAPAPIPGVQTEDSVLSFEVTPMSEPGDWSYGVSVADMESGSAYVFYLTSDGQYAVWSVVGDQQSIIVDYTPSEMIETSGTNWIRIVAHGEMWGLYVNGEQLAEITVTAFGERGFVFVVTAPSEQEVKVAFDNVALEE